MGRNGTNLKRSVISAHGHDLRKMATEKARDGILGGNSGGNQDCAAETMSNYRENVDEIVECDLGKMLARRAVFGSGHRRAGGRKVGTNDVKMSPSRLSRVSLPDESQDE